MKGIVQKEGRALAIPVIVLTILPLVIHMLLIIVGWPSLDSDEGLIGLQAIHIAYLGEHPTFLYGQEYMGTIQPYLASVFFRLFGISSFTLRLSTLLLFGFFLLSMYLLIRLLYTHKMALFILLLLGLGTQFMLTPEIMVEGGVVETLVFASLLMLLSTWLALTSRDSATSRWAYWRPILYGCWGLTAGAALWSDYLILPWLLGASLLLVIFCWREWKGVGFICLLIGFSIGALPIIIYNLHPVSGQNFFQVIWSIQHSSNTATITPLVKWRQFVGTFLYGVPLMSGLAPVCTLSDMPAFGPATTRVALCALLNGSWGLGYVALLLLAAVLAVLALRNLRHLYSSQPDAWSHDKQRMAVLHAARLMLLLAAALTIVLYALSPISGQRPWSTRYLTCMFVATPALFSPLWSGNSSVSLLPQRFVLRFASTLTILRRTLIALILLSLLISTSMIALMVPASITFNQDEHQLITDLLGRNITRIYSEYWTCGRLMFQSQEKIICAVVNNNVQVEHNRYEPYAKTVVADTRVAYIFPTDPVDAVYVNNCARKLSGLPYRRSTFDNYIIFAPV